MIPIDLNLNTRLVLGRDENSKIVEVGQFIDELQKRFPGGFYSREATKVHKKLYDARYVAFEGHEGIVPLYKLYQIMARRGYLEIIEEPRKSGADRFFYKHMPDTLKDYALDFVLKRKTGNLAQGQIELMKGYNTLMGASLSVDQIVDDAVDNWFLDKGQFVRIMGVLKQESPDVYAKMGGTYLDRLLQVKVREAK